MPDFNHVLFYKNDRQVQNRIYNFCLVLVIIRDNLALMVISFLYCYVELYDYISINCLYINKKSSYQIHKFDARMKYDTDRIH